MADLIPFAPSIPFQDFGLTFDGTLFVFNARWNQRAGAWYFDVFEDDQIPVIQGIKIVLGAYLGRRCNHRLFRTGVFVAVDLSGAGRDATLDDLGTRVQVARFSIAEVLSLRVTEEYPDPVEIAKAFGARGA